MKCWAHASNHSEGNKISAAVGIYINMPFWDIARAYLWFTPFDDVDMP